MYELPKTVLIDGKQFSIRNGGDYRVILDCFLALEDEELTEQERVLSSLIIFYDGVKDLDDLVEQFPNGLQEAVDEMFNFFNCGQPDGVGANTNRKLIDWEDDSQIIASAVNNVAKTEVRSLPYLHWWTFMGYYLSIGESVLSTVVEIRNKILTGKKLEKYEQEFKRDNPNYFVWNSSSVQKKEADELVKQLWNNE